MDDQRGGRLSLRLVSSDGAAAEYSGELVSEGVVCKVGIRVGADGQVHLNGPGAPDWLVAVTRSMLRAAWRATVAGTPWPRRLTRWRPAAGDRDSES